MPKVSKKPASKKKTKKKTKKTTTKKMTARKRAPTKSFSSERRIAVLPLVSAAALGMVAAYYLDPRLGHRRRVLVKDKWVHLRHALPDTAAHAGASAYFHVKGFLIEVGKLLSGRDSRWQRRSRQQKGSEAAHLSRESLDYGEIGVPSVMKIRKHGRKFGTDWDGEPLEMVERNRYDQVDSSPQRRSDPTELPVHALKNSPSNPVRSQRRSQNQFHKTQHRR